MHYTIAHPTNYGIDSYEPLLPSYSMERKENSKTELANALKLLASINPEKLSKDNAYTYHLLVPYLQNQQQGMELYYYANPLSPSSGTQSQLPILFAEYTFRCKQDIIDYLSLLEQTDTYFEGIAAYMKEQSAQGLFMPDYSADKVIHQCDAIMDASQLEAGTHFLSSTFRERLEPLLQQEIITEEEMSSYIADNSRLLQTVMLPAYTRLKEDLLLLKGSGTNESGLAHYPHGKEYYLYLLHASTGSYRDIEDIKQLLFQDYNQNLQSLYQLSSQNPALTSLPAETADAFLYTTPSDMLKNLQQMMADDFPALTRLSESIAPVCTVKSVSKNLEQYCSPAFYLTPPLDDISENVIYINQKNNPSGVSLYTTLAHEGYPGHLYQTVYSQLYLQKSNANPVRSLLNYGGYTEGWAMYVELRAYDYAKRVMKDTAPQAEIVYEAYRLDRQIQLCLYSLLDIAIHYEGAAYPQVHKILSSIGINNPSSTRSIYEYITEEPTNYLKYYLGYLEILNLQQEAKELWGNGYSDYLFHKFYLENGPADFSALSRQLQTTGAPVA